MDIAELTILPGKFAAIIGPSGSAKSTLLNILSGLDKPTNGEVFVDGENIARMSDGKLSKFRRNKIGFVFQFFYLQPFLDVQKNIESAAFPNKISRKNRADFAKSLAQIVGLNSKIHEYPRNLSGGEIQRVAIARSLINSPSILFADEPTGNLDSENSRKVIDFLIKVQQEKHMTLVIVTHDEGIAKLADQIIRITDGKIIEIREKQFEVLRGNLNSKNQNNGVENA